MATANVTALARSVQKTKDWLEELAGELGVDDDEAWRMLRAYLQVLRDRLTLDEGARLAAQLPQVLRGVFYEGFDPGRQPERIRSTDELLQRLADRAQLADTARAAEVAAAATRVLERHVQPGELDYVTSQLSAGIPSPSGTSSPPRRSRADRSRGV
jgi:uncharacterized protein (DUF2267 family)